MSGSSTKVGHMLAKGLGIKLKEPEPVADDVTRGESVFSGQTGDTFVEQSPTTADFLRELVPSGRDVLHYIHTLFPFVDWIGHYNLQWFAGDVVAGALSGQVNSTGCFC